MNRPIEIVAEVGINHNGDLTVAKELMTGAVTAGADAVKFQIYDPRKRPDIEEHPWRDLLFACELKRRQIYEIMEHGNRIDTEVFFSVIDPDRVAWTEEVDVKRYKMASKTALNLELYEAILKTGKPLCLSLGLAINDNGTINTAKRRQIRETLFSAHRNIIKDGFVSMVITLTTLYCQMKYPAGYENTNFIDKDDHTSIFPTNFFGYSDHTIGIHAAIVAMCYGARCIEKHITLDQGADGPDHKCSATIDDLAELCRHRDEIEKFLSS